MGVLLGFVGWVNQGVFLGMTWGCWVDVGSGWSDFGMVGVTLVLSG